MKRNMLFGLAALAAVTAAGCANAHGVWFAPRLDKTQLVLGEGPKDNAYDPNGTSKNPLPKVIKQTKIESNK